MNGLFAMMNSGTVCYTGVSVLHWGNDPQRGNFGQKHVPDKPNTHDNCKLDWSIQRHTTGADA